MMKKDLSSYAPFPDLKTLSKEGVKLLIFDLDGTLLDSMTVWHDVDKEFLGRYGYEVTPGIYRSRKARIDRRCRKIYSDKVQDPAHMAGDRRRVGVNGIRLLQV